MKPREKKFISIQDFSDFIECLELQKAIRQFHWIGPAMLGAHIDRSLDSVRDLLDQAVNQILQTNAETLPR